MARLQFTKMHGAGNDFVMIDALQGDPVDYVRHARLIADRRFGVGCDQLLVARPSTVADFQMRIFNADGSEVEMCGNGIRCFHKYLFDRGHTDKTELEVETPAGIIRPRLVEGGVRVDMGPPVLEGREVPVDAAGRILDHPLEVEGAPWPITAVSMGNPHAVIFVDEVALAPVRRIGPLLENHAFFPNRTNVEFLQLVDRTEGHLRVWERGSGETLACGTGACGAMVAAHLHNQVDDRVTLHLPGGDLIIEWDGDENSSVYMTGPAESVFDGEMDLPD